MYLHRKFQFLVGTPFLPAVQETEFAFANDLGGGAGGGGAGGTAIVPTPDREHRFRFSGCKLAADRTSKYRFIPAEYGVVLLQYDDDHQGNVDFIREQFTAHSLVRVPTNEPYFVLAKVEEIGTLERVHVYDRTTKVTVLLTEPRARGSGGGGGGAMSGGAAATANANVDTAGQRELIFWDNQTVMRGLLKRGDIIAIAEPYIPEETDGNGRSESPPLATDNLLENTDGVGAPRQCSLGAAACYF